MIFKTSLKTFFAVFLCLGFILESSSQNLITSVEAEDGILSGGVTIANQAYGSSGMYVTNFKNAGDKLKVTIAIPKGDTYTLKVSYRSEYGEKFQDFYLDGTMKSSVAFSQSSNFVETTLLKGYLSAGNHTIEIVNSWGYVDLDKFSVYIPTPFSSDSITPNLIDPLATNEAKNLYAFLKSQFGKKIISGQTDDYFDDLVAVTSKTPMLRAYDFQKYTQGYPYLWRNGGHTFGADPSARDTENAINWYNNTSQKKGIISFQWHWHSPSGGQVNTNTFYTDETSFDVRQAVINGTTENTLILQDIDAIAVELKKLQTAGVPVIWRPLHEAGGKWFWWGAHGSTASKKLYDIVYDRIVNYNSVHNLIWEWSTPEPSWYPGNNKVDMIGYDSYPGEYNYNEQKNAFEQLYAMGNGKKLIAMSENGPIPDIQKCFDSDAPWSYFMSWADLVTEQNSTQHLINVYTNSSVLTLESSTLGLEEINTNEMENIKYFPNPFNDYLSIKTGSEIADYSIYDLSGRVLEKGKTNQLIGRNLPKGIFIIKGKTSQKSFAFKVIKN